MEKVIFDSVEHQYFDLNKKEYPSVTKILKHFGMTPDYDRFGNEASKNFGLAVHKVTELYDRGTLDDFNYNSKLDPWLEGYKMFLEEYKPSWISIEEPMISKVWGFAGTTDRVCVIKRNVLFDIKTGSPDPYHGIQTGGYEVLAEENLNIKIKKRYTLYLATNNFTLVQNENRSDRSIFIGLALAYSFKKRNKLC